MNPATGPKSVSFKFAAGGVLTGLGTLITGLVQNPNSLSNGAAAVSDVRSAVGALIVVVSIVAKLFHDNGFNKASFAAAGHDLAEALPEIRDNLAKAAGLVESDFPSLKNDFDNFRTAITQHLQEIDSRVTTLTGITPQDIEDAVRHIMANAAPLSTTRAPAAPSGEPTTPSTI